MKPPKQQCLEINRRENKSLPDESFSQTSIGDLSDGILTHILSFLPTTTAAKTSAVAPAWRYLWHSVPVLDFNMKAFHQSRAPDKSVRSTRQLFAEMLSQSLLQRPRHFPVRKFKLSFGYRNYHLVKCYVDSWLRFVIGEETEVLDLNFSMYRKYDMPAIEGPAESEDSDDEEEGEDSDDEGGGEDSDDEGGGEDSDDEGEGEDSDDEEEGEDSDDDEENEHDLVFDNYQFQYSALVNSSVSVLKLNCCDPCMPSNNMPIKLHLLREIHLERLWCFDGVMAHLLASCVNLEILSVVMVEFMEDWKIESKSLKHFKYQCYTEFESDQNSVEIRAQNLESLMLSDESDMKYSLEDTTSLVAADVKFPRRGWRDYAGWTNLVCSLVGVERLTFQNMWSLPDKRKKKPLDESYENLSEPKEEIFSETFVFHNLKHVELWTGYSENDIFGLEILLKKCPQLETIALVNTDRFPSSSDLKGVKSKPIVLQMSRVKFVEMKDFKNDVNEVFVAGLLKEHGVVLDKIVAYPKTWHNEEPRPPFAL